MSLAKIDKNFKLNKVTTTDVVWYDPRKNPFSIYGVNYDYEQGCFVRLPRSVAEQTSDGVLFLHSHTAGGRIRFKTNSPFVALKSVAPNVGVMNHMPITVEYGFSIYINGQFCARVSPGFEEISHDSEKEVETDGLYEIPSHEKGALYDVEVYLPLYGGIKQLYVGLKKGSTILSDTPYKYTKPVLFYGSSITQGGCTSRPGNDYISYLSRWLDTDVINLGFSGSAKAEDNMIKYLCSLDPSVFVLDYDHNAPDVQHLKNTHFALYSQFRSAHKNTPIIIMSKPDFYRCVITNTERRSVIYDTYLKALSLGDKNVYFIDGETLFGKKDYDSCTVDGTHPTDLGFYRIAQSLLPVLKKAIEENTSL